QFGGIQLGNQVAGVHLTALIHRQLLNAAHDLGTHNHLVGIHDADQLQVAGVVVEENEVQQGNHKDDSDQNEKFFALRHRGPLLAWLRFFDAAGLDTSNMAATASMTAALRSAMRSGASGFLRVTSANMGALLK